MKSLIAAFQFLTTLPLPIHVDAKAFGRAPQWFGVTGVFIGGGAAALYYHTHPFIEAPLLVATLVVVLLAVLSGALHLDGLADSFDGLFSHRPRERKLEIMRDSRLGVMGVLGLIGSILLKVTAVASFTGVEFWKIILLAPILSRSVMAMTLSLFPYAREEGMASSFLDEKHMMTLILSALILFAASWYLLGLDGLIYAGIAIILALAFNLFVLKLLGGITGDTCGATAEIVETILLISACFVGVGC